jgi:hypothetical protein
MGRYVRDGALGGDGHKFTISTSAPHLAFHCSKTRSTALPLGLFYSLNLARASYYDGAESHRSDYSRNRGQLCSSYRLYEQLGMHSQKCALFLFFDTTSGRSYASGPMQEHLKWQETYRDTFRFLDWFLTRLECYYPLAHLPAASHW